MLAELGPALLEQPLTEESWAVLKDALADSVGALCCRSLALQRFQATQRYQPVHRLWYQSRLLVHNRHPILCTQRMPLRALPQPTQPPAPGCLPAHVQKRVLTRVCA